MTLPQAEALLRRGLEDGLHVGAQLHVSLAGREVASVSLGEARPGVALTPATLLPWFSGTKPITAAAVLQQWERGRLRLDDPVARHVPEFGVNGKERVTVRHVLTHTAGFPQAGGGASLEERRTWEETLADVCAAPLVDRWVPGRRAAYHPRGSFFLLGEIVQRLDGRPFDAYVAEELFEPLGMADSWLALPPQRHAAYGDRVAVMHVTADGRREPLRGTGGPEAYAAVVPSGGAVGPASELCRFYEMLLGGGELEGVRVLLPQTVEAMTARHRVGLRDETFGTEIDWGLGVMVNSWYYHRRPAPYGYGDLASPRAFGHGGSQSSVSFADPEPGLAVALICNGLPGERANHRRTQPVLTAVYRDLGLEAPAAGPEARGPEPSGL